MAEGFPSLPPIMQQPGGDAGAQRAKRLMPFVIAACAVAAPLTMSSEGKKNTGYLDPSRIPTICFGHTGPEVRVGAWWSDGTCKDVFTKDQQRLAVAALQCTPDEVVKNRYVFGSVVDFTFNGGAGLYCRSSMARDFGAGHYAAGCRDFLKYRFSRNRATGRMVELPGLKIRRGKEAETCMKGIAP